MSDVSEYSWRRAAVGIFTIVCFVIGLYQSQTSDGSNVMGRTVFLRAAIAMGLLWIAWPSLQRPAKWMPPAALALAVLGLCLLVVQPKFVVFVIPAIGLITSVAVVLKWYRKFLN